MIKIARFFEIQFSDEGFSAAELLSFSHDHVARLANQNFEGRYNTMLAATTNAYEAFGGTVSDETTVDAIGKARTTAKTDHLETIKKKLSGLSGTLHGKFGNESVQYTEFFPQGLTEIHKATEPRVKPILDRIVQAATTHLPEEIEELTALRSTWDSLYQSASDGRASTGDADQIRQEANAALQLQLTKNLLELALEYVGQPAKAAVFFDESRLYNPKQSESSPPNAE